MTPAEHINSLVNNPALKRVILSQVVSKLSKDDVEHLETLYPGDVSVDDRLAYFKAGLVATPSCPVCGTVPSRQGVAIKTCCSKKCSEQYKKNTGQVAQIDSRRRATNLVKYGVELPSQMDDHRAKVADTSMARYGVSHASQNEEFKARLKKTNLERYGVEHVSQRPDVKAAKSRDCPTQAHINNLDEYRDDIKFSELYEELTLAELMEYFGIAVATVHRRARMLGINHPVSSKAENDIAALVESTGVEVIRNSRTVISPYELDIYIPELKLAVEYCGLYWHSEDAGKKDKSYHVNKLLACEAQDIRLITIFSDEWEFKQDIVRSRLLNLLGQSRRIFARQCQVREVDTPTARTFLTDNHIQGVGHSVVKLGLYHDDVLVSVMTFSSSNYAKRQKGWEIDRFCNLAGVTVVGGASRLFKYFIRTHPDVHEMVSFADRRWSDGGLYHALGMMETSRGQPNYWYMDDYTTRVHRARFQKARIENADPMLTEWQNMQARGYDRVWDCGSLKFVWNRP